MDSYLAAGFGAPQIIPQSPGSFLHQTTDWYEYQQATDFSTNEYGPGGRCLSPVYRYEQGRLNRDFIAELRFLQKYYTVLDNDELIVQVLEEEPALYALLIEAVAPLKSAFGTGRIIQVRIQFSEDDMLVKVAVQLPAGSVADAEGILQSFDEAWWLNNCHRSGGGLVFDYEIQDGL